ncbi:phage tail sheath family protein [Enterobacter cloacae]|nr:phage tail sheath family protein [Enterobacter cloacae]
MTVVTSYPGLYIKEIESTAMSVSSSATAVPVFAIEDDDKIFTSTTRISSWLDYMNHLGKAGFNNSSIRDISIRTYFENGGGYCYLVPLGMLITEVPKLDDATLLVAAGQNIQSEVATLCTEGKNMFAILDGPRTEDEVTDTDSKWHDMYDETPYAAIYFPWLTAPWVDQKTHVPPSAVVAGAYCFNDRTRGVWKAPANMVTKGGVLPLYKVTDDFQGKYTSGGKALNMIRHFNNGTPVIWGSRTCEDTDSWRYVPVRRLFNSVEKDIKDAMQHMMYEPNSQPTWERVRSAVANYLYGMWKQGALTGAKPEDAYFVHIGLGTTMTNEEVNQGKMIVKVGMAAVRPAEFIILQFTQDVAQ